MLFAVFVWYPAGPVVLPGHNPAEIDETLQEQIKRSGTVTRAGTPATMRHTVNVDNPAMRAQWLRDMRTLMEKHHLGWAMWDYQDNFGAVTKKDGRTVPDPAVIEALGLTMPTSPKP